MLILKKNLLHLIVPVEIHLIPLPPLKKPPPLNKPIRIYEILDTFCL